MATDEIRIRTRQNEETTVVSVVGAIDLATSPALDDAVMKALADAPRALTIDLRRANHFDSSGIRILVRAMRVSRTNDVELAVCVRSSSPIHKVLELSGVIGVVPIVEEC